MNTKTLRSEVSVTHAWVCGGIVFNSAAFTVGEMGRIALGAVNAREAG